MAQNIPKDFIDNLLEKVNIVDVIGNYIKLEKKGNDYWARCPFHSEKTSSFSVSENKQFFHCFGCGAHGNSIGFVMDHSNKTYPEAIEVLAIQAGLDPEKGKIKDNNYNEQINLNLFKLIDEAKNFYTENLKTSNIPKLYLDKRDVNKEIISKF